MTKNQTSFEKGHTAAEKHGIHTFEARGVTALEPGRLSRLAELRQLVKSQPGRLELREELTARCALIVDIAMSELVKTHEAGDSIWDSPVIKRAGTYLAEMRRLLDSFPPDDADNDVTDQIRRVIEHDRQP